MKLLSIEAWKLVLILYLFPIIQVLTQEGLVIGGVLIGLFPSTILYFTWLSMLSYKLRVKQSNSKRKKVLTINFINLILVVPTYWIVLNYSYSDKDLFVALQPIGGLVLVWMIVTLVVSWRHLAIVLTDLLRAKNIRTLSGRILLFFIFGPVTIWWLQPIIKNALTSPKLTASS